MPEPKHFDVESLLTQTHAARIGLEVKTNHPSGFRRVLYAEMRKAPHLRVKVLQKSPDVFLLVKPEAMLPTVEAPESISVADLEDEL